MKELDDFVKQFNAHIILDESHIVKKWNRYYLLVENLKQQIPSNFFYAGVYLGAVKGASFFPSFLLLEMINKGKGTSIVVDKKTAWLFICGRDIFKQGILKGDDLKKGAYTLVLNEFNECLGFGKVVLNISEEVDAKTVVVKNILDIGDFLRRERHQNNKQQRSQNVEPLNREPRKRARKQNTST